ncbi:response regulator [Zafaria sp. Z1313]|uniref:response regulator n=1 Tax=unclassified Zafaria TaxID=2828765 RepID=UPI003D301857
MGDGTAPLRVLVADDEPIAAAAHADYVGRVAGFAVAGIAHTGGEVLELLRREAESGRAVDLVLLDMNLPDLHGLDVARRIRGRGDTVDIIAITAVRELAVVRTAVAAGITQYLIKPFTFAAFRDKLENFRGYRLNLADSGSAATQDSIDSAFAALRTAAPPVLPKGLINETLGAVAGLLRQDGSPLSATEVADRLQMSRVTARRYLEHLAADGRADKQPRHGTRGRPEFEYLWLR